MSTKLRSVRVEEGLWRLARAKARTEGTTVTAVIIRALKRYVGVPADPW